MDDVKKPALTLRKTGLRLLNEREIEEVVGGNNGEVQNQIGGVTYSCPGSPCRTGVIVLEAE